MNVNLLSTAKYSWYFQTGFEWIQLDCYGDKVSDRRLKRYYKSTGVNPPNPAEHNLKPAYESCKAGAEAKNYDFFGIQNTYECWGEIGVSHRGGGGGRTWVKFCWVCATGFSEPLLHYSLFCGQL